MLSNAKAFLVLCIYSFIFIFFMYYIYDWTANEFPNKFPYVSNADIIILLDKTETPYIYMYSDDFLTVWSKGGHIYHGVSQERFLEISDLIESQVFESPAELDQFIYNYHIKNWATNWYYNVSHIMTFFDKAQTAYIYKYSDDLKIFWSNSGHIYECVYQDMLTEICGLIKSQVFESPAELDQFIYNYYIKNWVPKGYSSDSCVSCGNIIGLLDNPKPYMYSKLFMIMWSESGHIYHGVSQNMFLEISDLIESQVFESPAELDQFVYNYHIKNWAPVYPDISENF